VYVWIDLLNCLLRWKRTRHDFGPLRNPTKKNAQRVSGRGAPRVPLKRLQKMQYNTKIGDSLDFLKTPRNIQNYFWVTVQLCYQWTSILSEKQWKWRNFLIFRDSWPRKRDNYQDKTFDYAWGVSICFDVISIETLDLARHWEKVSLDSRENLDSYKKAYFWHSWKPGHGWNCWQKCQEYWSRLAVGHSVVQKVKVTLWKSLSFNKFLLLILDYR
jgi:hypothetical protein